MLAEPALRIGVDIARISTIEATLAAFGEHFLRRIFSDDEAAYSLQVPALAGQRLAARFAAKEAAMKAFGLSEAGIGWRDIEVRRAADGSCTLALHGVAGAVAAKAGCGQVAVSLSHDGDYATAMVAALPGRRRPHDARRRRSTAPRPEPRDRRKASARRTDTHAPRLSTGELS